MKRLQEAMDKADDTMAGEIKQAHKDNPKLSPEALAKKTGYDVQWVKHVLSIRNNPFLK